MLKSRFGFRAYLVFIIVPVFWAFPTYLIFHPDTIIKGRFNNDNDASALGLFLFFFGLLLGFIYSRILYFIKIEGQSIFIKGLFIRRRIELSDIHTINLFSKEDFYWTAGTIGIATRVDLNSGRKVIIPDFFYRNIHLIKQVIAENFKEKIISYKNSIAKYTPQSSIESDFTKFSGNVNTSLKGLLFYGFTIVFLFLLVKTAHPVISYLIVAIVEVIFYLGFGSQLNYFLISDRRLIVKNHFLFWVNKSYNTEDIAAVDFELPYRRSKSIRVVTNDFKSRLFGAGSLRDKKWNELKEKLKGLQVNFVE